MARIRDWEPGRVPGKDQGSHREVSGQPLSRGGKVVRLGLEISVCFVHRCVVVGGIWAGWGLWCSARGGHTPNTYALLERGCFNTLECPSKVIGSLGSEGLGGTGRQAGCTEAPGTGQLWDELPTDLPTPASPRSRKPGCWQDSTSWTRLRGTWLEA